MKSLILTLVCCLFATASMDACVTISNTPSTGTTYTVDTSGSFPGANKSKKQERFAKPKGHSSKHKNK